MMSKVAAATATTTAASQQDNNRGITTVLLRFKASETSKNHKRYMDKTRTAFLIFDLGIVFDLGKTAAYICAKTKKMRHRETIIFHKIVSLPPLGMYIESIRKKKRIRKAFSRVV
jgi:hypothetical protein